MATATTPTKSKTENTNKNDTDNLEDLSWKVVSLAREMRPLIEKYEDGVPQIIRDILRADLCKLVISIVPDVSKKIDEYIFEDEHNKHESAKLVAKSDPSSTESKDKPLANNDSDSDFAIMDTRIVARNLRVNPHPNGPDLITENGDFIEVKTSIYKKGQRVNVHLELPSMRNDETARRRKFLESIIEKTKGGGLIVRIKNGVGVLLLTYFIHHDFLMEYCSRIHLGTASTYNMGCKRCKTCKGFHRIQKLMMYSDYMHENDLETLTEKQWADVLGRTSIDCGGKDLQVVD